MLDIAIHKRYVLLLSKLIRWRMGSGSSSKEKPKPEVKAQPSQPPSNSLSGKSIIRESPCKVVSNISPVKRRCQYNIYSLLCCGVKDSSL